MSGNGRHGEFMSKEQRHEFEKLVREVGKKGFTQSAEVSKYIVKHQLGFKYPNISGHLEMSNSKDTWVFVGGFPPQIYAELCDRLDVGDKGTRATAGKFESFAELERKGRPQYEQPTTDSSSSARRLGTRGGW